jgi:hypothetical protein
MTVNQQLPVGSTARAATKVRSHDEIGHVRGASSDSSPT